VCIRLQDHLSECKQDRVRSLLLKSHSGSFSGRSARPLLASNAQLHLIAEKNSCNLALAKYLEHDIPVMRGEAVHNPWYAEVVDNIEIMSEELLRLTPMELWRRGRCQEVSRKVHRLQQDARWVSLNDHHRRAIVEFLFIVTRISRLLVFIERAPRSVDGTPTKQRVATPAAETASVSGLIEQPWFFAAAQRGQDAAPITKKRGSSASLLCRALSERSLQEYARHHGLMTVRDLRATFQSGIFDTPAGVLSPRFGALASSASAVPAAPLAAVALDPSSALYTPSSSAYSAFSHFPGGGPLAINAFPRRKLRVNVAAAEADAAEVARGLQRATSPLGGSARGAPHTPPAFSFWAAESKSPKRGTGADGVSAALRSAAERSPKAFSAFSASTGSSRLSRSGKSPSTTTPSALLSGARVPHNSDNHDQAARSLRQRLILKLSKVVVKSGADGDVPLDPMPRSASTPALPLLETDVPESSESGETGGESALDENTASDSKQVVCRICEYWVNPENLLEHTQMCAVVAQCEERKMRAVYCDERIKAILESLRDESLRDGLVDEAALAQLDGFLQALTEIAHVTLHLSPTVQSSGETLEAEKSRIRTLLLGAVRTLPSELTEIGSRLK
jgi:hypothetical protein